MEQRLPLYYFHIRTPGGLAEDPEGEELLDLSLAIEAAADSARELLIERLKRHERADDHESRIEITDEKGTVLAVLEFAVVLTGKC
jgi:hypothetical protein